MVVWIELLKGFDIPLVNDMSFVETLKTAISKTSLANIGSFFLILGILYYGITTNDRDIILTVGSAGIGYLFGVSGSKS